MIVELKNVKKYFLLKHRSAAAAGGPSGETRVRAVDGVSLSISEGENLGLVGESGSGKTTLGRVLLKLYDPDEGKIILKGEDITRYSSARMRPLRKYVQMVFQDPYSSLDPRYTVYRILREADVMVNPPQDRPERMAHILESVGLSQDSLMRFPHEFSGGERQRIAIARALIMNPSLLILDEAVSSLDVLIQQQILELLKDLQEKFDLTYLFISHNLRVIRKICRRIAVMYKGKIVEMAESDELFRNPLHPYTRELLAAAIDYKALDQPYSYNIPENSCLSDRGNGHFVIN